MAKILLVEDDKSLREIYGVRLQAEGYEIVSAGDGEEALALAIKERPDLIVSDVMMPKISGFDMLDILRSTSETKDVKVIMMTALSSEDQRARGESLGADRYLVKSQVGIEDVVRTVHEVFGDIPTAAPAAMPTPAPAPSPVAMPAPAPVAPSPAPVAAPVEPALPQPTAPFSSPAPASLGTQIREANSMPAPAPVTMPTPAPAPSPVAMPAAPTPVMPSPVAIPTPAPVAAPAPAAPAPAPAPAPAIYPDPVAVSPAPAPAPVAAPAAPAQQAPIAQPLDLASQMAAELGQAPTPPTTPPQV